MTDDDRDQALAWYLRRRLIQEEERGVTQQAIADGCGLTQAQVSYIRNDAKSAGLRALIALSRYFRREPGELLTEALEWWERKGRDEAAQEAATIAKRRAEAAAAAKVKRKKHQSGEHQSVGKLPLAAGHDSSTPPPAPGLKQKK